MHFYDNTIIFNSIMIELLYIWIHIHILFSQCIPLQRRIYPQGIRASSSPRAPSSASLSIVHWPATGRLINQRCSVVHCCFSCIHTAFPKSSVTVFPRTHVMFGSFVDTCSQNESNPFFLLTSSSTGLLVPRCTWPTMKVCVMVAHTSAHYVSAISRKLFLNVMRG